MGYLSSSDFREFCINQHDVVCSQKYSGVHPYSLHLGLVVKQASLFRYLIDDDDYNNVVIPACWGHDLIEDARLTYNDIKSIVGFEIADIIYCCTEEKGKNRDERHSDKYFSELVENDLAVFVKLCDIIANVKWSLLTNSPMFGKYKKEFSKIKEKLYNEDYSDIFDYLERILSVQK